MKEISTFIWGPRRQVETCPVAGWRLLCAASPPPPSRLCNETYSALQRATTHFATYHTILHIHMYVCTCMCNTFVMIAQIVILITEFNKTNKNKEGVGSGGGTLRKLKMFVTFCNSFSVFFSVLPPICGQLGTL